MTRQYDNYGRDQYNIENLGNATFNQTQIIQIAVAEIKTRPLNTTSPYRGLKPFGHLDKDYFFGRDQFLTGLVNELEQTNVILLLGASGSGKSSVVRAGLIPWLLQKWGSHLVPLILKPNQDPFEALYGSLLNPYGQSEAEMARAGTVDTLSQVVQTLKQRESFWLIFIDQFEELFTTSQPEKRDCFIESLVKLSQERSNDPSLKIVATMRADFLDRLDLAPANRLAKITDGHRPLMTQMHPDELRLAIEQPAAHHGVVFEAGLVETIIQDVQGQAGYLPLLQYTLNRLWEEALKTGDLQQERTLHTTTYLQLGGVRGALQQHVDAIYQRLQQEGNHLVTQRIFLKLVEIGGDAESGTDWKPVRRRANRSEFKDEQEKAVLAQLIDETLIVSDRDLPAQAQESTVEIAHEILLTSWTTLNTWIKENRRAIALRNRLNDDMERWQTKKTEDELWTGSKLEQVLELRNNPTFNQVLGGFSATANQFIDASEGKRDRQLRFYRNTAIGALAAAICITGIALFAGYQWRAADHEQIKALTASAKAKFSSNRDTFDAVIEALSAGKRLQQSFWFKNDPQLKADVMEVLAETTNWSREYNRLEGHNNFVWSVSFSPDGKTIATTGWDGTVRLWEPDGTEQSVLKDHTDKVTGVSFSRDNQFLVTCSQDGTAKVRKRDGTVLKTLKSRGSFFWRARFSPDGRTVAAVSEDGRIILWDWLTDSSQVWQGHPRTIYDVDFSPNGQTIATAGDEAVIKLWGRNKTLKGILRSHTEAVTAVRFSPTGDLLASASKDQTAILWDWKNRLKQRTLTGHSQSLNDVQFTADGQRLATAGNDAIIYLWNRNGSLITTLKKHNAQVNSISFSPDGKSLASASVDETVKLWHLQPHINALKEYTDAVYTVSFKRPGGQRLVTDGEKNSIKLWRADGTLERSWRETDVVNSIAFSPVKDTIATTSGQYINLWSIQGKLIKTVGTHSKPVLGVSFSPDGSIIASAGVDKVAKLWTLTGQPLKTLKGHTEEVHSVQFSPDGSTIATAGWDGAVKLWSQTGELQRSFAAFDKQAYRISFSPDSKVIATVGQSSVVKLWKLDGTPLFPLKGHTKAVSDVSFSPDGQMIATTGDDGTIKLWTRDSKLMMTLLRQDSAINALSFSPDGKRLAAASKDKAVLIIDVENLTVNGLMQRGCSAMANYFHRHRQASMDLCSNR